MKSEEEHSGRTGTIFRYLVVGGLTTVVSLGVYGVLVMTVLNPQKPVQLQTANVISWITAVLFAYVASRSFVFQSRNRHFLREARDFFAARLGTLALDMGIMFLGVTVLGVDNRLVKLLVQVVVTVGNYLLSRFFVFRGD